MSSKARALVDMTTAQSFLGLESPKSPERLMKFFFFSFLLFSKCANTELLGRQVLRKKLLLVRFFQQPDSNPGWLSAKRERYRCAMPSPQAHQVNNSKAQLKLEWFFTIARLELDCSHRKLKKIKARSISEQNIFVANVNIISI